jgi:hypothetical protein
MRPIYVLLASAGLFCASPAFAQMVTAKDPQSIIKVLQDAGFQAKLAKSKDGDPMIESASSGSKFRVFFFNCTANSDCATVQFYTAYDTDTGKAPSLEKVNDWNRGQRFGRAYLDTEGDPAIEMDVDLDDGGMSQALFTDNLEFWTTIMAKFEQHIGW